VQCIVYFDSILSRTGAKCIVLSVVIIHILYIRRMMERVWRSMLFCWRGRYVHTCHGSGCSSVSEHLVLCGSSSGFVCTEKCVAHMTRSLFNRQRFATQCKEF